MEKEPGTEDKVDLRDFDFLPESMKKTWWQNSKQEIIDFFAPPTRADIEERKFLFRVALFAVANMIALKLAGWRLVFIAWLIFGGIAMAVISYSCATSDTPSRQRTITITILALIAAIFFFLAGMLVR